MKKVRLLSGDVKAHSITMRSYRQILLLFAEGQVEYGL